jgi:Tfp pilus assembly protein PilN
MEQQNINLLGTGPEQQDTRFQASLLTQIAIGWMVFLIVIYALSWVHSLYLDRQYAAVNKINTETLKKIQDLSQKATTLTASTQNNLSNVPKVDTQKLQGFYNYLEDLAEFTPAGIWFNQISFSRLGDNIMLNGNALSATMVPELLNSLIKSDDMHNKKFSTLQLQKSDKNNSVSFTLSTTLSNPEASTNK